MIYQLTIVTGKREFEAAARLVDNSEPSLLKAYGLVDSEKQSKLLFCFGLACFNIKNFKKAHKYTNEVVQIAKINYQAIL